MRRELEKQVKNIISTLELNYFCSNLNLRFYHRDGTTPDPTEIVYSVITWAWLGTNWAEENKSPRWDICVRGCIMKPRFWQASSLIQRDLSEDSLQTHRESSSRRWRSRAQRSSGDLRWGLSRFRYLVELWALFAGRYCQISGISLQFWDFPPETKSRIVE